jgi:hypothetical protein
VRTRINEFLRVAVVVVALIGALTGGNPVAWAILVTVLDRVIK